nr:zinc finger protein 431-like [Leptinotarsa decemlineata]
METFSNLYLQSNKQPQINIGPNYSIPQVNNNFLSSVNYMDVYNTSTGSIQNRQQNYYASSTDQLEHLNWENRLIPDVAKNIKMPDKMEMIEISCKNPSPVGYISNADLESPKPLEKEANYFTRFNNQWYSQNNCERNYELPSCAQVSTHLDKSQKFCSIQKNYDLDFFTKSCGYIDNLPPESSDFFNKNGYKSSSDFVPDYNSYNYYDKNQFCQPVSHNENFFGTSSNIPFTPIINPIDQQTEDSNDDSDIIVEESDDEVTDHSEDHDRRQQYQTNRCLVCNINYTPLGTQFYLLTTENPLTMSSQRPVINKITEIVGAFSTKKNYLCSECLGLINTIDHLQLKLENFNEEFITKFKKTCKENNISVKKKILNEDVKITKKLYSNKFLKFRCRLCKNVFCLQSFFRYHIKRHKTRKFLCDLCGLVSISRRKFLLHLKVHKKIVNIDPLKCSNCEKTHRTKSNLREHQNFCLGILPFVCKQHYCNKKFASANKLKNHVKLKHDKKFIAICSICNIGFVKVSDYKSHMVTHSTDKKYSCSKCSKSYKTISNLNFHMKVHNSSRPFTCSICAKGFMRKEYLEAHVNNHKGIKNYSCTVCDKRFASQKNLDAHSKYHEGTIKKNTCNICGKTMTSGFEEHLKTHSNLREFECESCDMKFNTRGAFRKHVKKKHTGILLNK